jgi:hypothetical protein
MGTIDTGIAAAAALFSGGAAVAAYMAARQANLTAGSLAQIERDRWHVEMTPQVGLKFSMSRGFPELLVDFRGPAPLLQVEVALTIRDDKERGVSQLAGGPTAQQVADTIWGPFRFRPGVDGADSLGRTVAPVPLKHRARTRFALDPSLAPAWVVSERAWRSDYNGEDMRVWVGCSAVGHKPWLLTANVRTDPTVRGVVAA